MNKSIVFLEESELDVLPPRIEVLIDKGNKTPAEVIEFFKWCIENTGHEFNFSCWLEGKAEDHDVNLEFATLDGLKSSMSALNLCGTAACIAGSVSTILALYRPDKYREVKIVLDNTINWSVYESPDEELADKAVSKLCQNENLYGQRDMEDVKKEHVYRVFDKVSKCDTWEEALLLINQIKRSFHSGEYWRDIE